ncbi:hypothetical protein BC830DRAFT_1150758 [Chytriomyces sp. MP71]|nr:hypothetical protein BC830DRAFT_1154400 [Chytriomyces sp. MP71]KAI8609401.1 hypothetical protein BC830DRAFT_1150758 [Chytriomyces sp. MP71]
MMLFRAALYDLEQENARLKEEANSYQMLLERKSTTGNFLAHSALVQSVTTKPMIDEDAVSPEISEIMRLQSEVKALTLYIEKVLLKVVSAPKFDSAIVKTEFNHPRRSQRPSSVLGSSSDKAQNRISYLSRLPISAVSVAVELYRGVSKRTSAPASTTRRQSVPPESTTNLSLFAEERMTGEGRSGGPVASANNRNSIVGYVGKMIGSRLVSSAS